jgi:hypothetical protein
VGVAQRRLDHALLRSPSSAPDRQSLEYNASNSIDEPLFDIPENSEDVNPGEHLQNQQALP